MTGICSTAALSAAWPVAGDAAYGLACGPSRDRRKSGVAQWTNLRFQRPTLLSCEPRSHHSRVPAAQQEGYAVGAA
jgi:hypothetical protein